MPTATYSCGLTCRRLADLIAVRTPSVVGHGARRADRRVSERGREILDELEVLRRLEPAAAAHDHRRLAEVELGPSPLFDFSFTTTRDADGSPTGCSCLDARRRARSPPA